MVSYAPFRTIITRKRCSQEEEEEEEEEKWRLRMMRNFEEKGRKVGHLGHDSFCQSRCFGTELMVFRNLA